MALIEYGPLICNAVGGLADVVFGAAGKAPPFEPSPPSPTCKRWPRSAAATDSTRSAKHGAH